MCTVLQQHLNQTNGFGDLSSPRDDRNNGSQGGGGTVPSAGTATPSGASTALYRHVSPVRLQPIPIYSYLQDVPNLKRPIDPYDRKISTPAMHFHVPQVEEGTPVGGRAVVHCSGRASRTSYMNQLLGRRSRSQSRTGMRVLVDQIQTSTPRARSPHMNNEEPINLSHYPDGRAPDIIQEQATNGENGVDSDFVDGRRSETPARLAPIERDDFPAPPFAFGGGMRRRRHYSEPESSRQGDSRESTPVQSSDEEEEEVPDPKAEKTEEELRKISTGMGKVFLQELAIDKERKKSLKNRFIDPRSAARTPAARKEPHFRLRYDSPLNASPSRVADHLRPWDDEVDGPGCNSRRSNVTTPFLPHTPHPQRVVSPINPIRPGYTQKAQTLPSRFSPGGGYDSAGEETPLGIGLAGEKTYSTEFSSKSGSPVHATPTNGVRSHSEGNTPRGENIRVSSTYTQGLQSATPCRPVSGGRATSTPRQGHGHEEMVASSNGTLNRSLPNMPSPLQAPNVYPLHLLFTTNYRLPGDVERINLERHLSDAEFDMVFRCTREEFYMMPYWKRCDLKRKYHLF